MEGFASTLHNSFKVYWKKRYNYRRIDESQPCRNNRVELADSNQVKRFLRANVAVLKHRFFGAAKRAVLNLRDAYVDMMIRLAKSRSLNSGLSGGAVGYGFERVPEYDGKMVVVCR